MRESAQIFRYGKIIAGKVDYIVRIPVAAGTYNEGDLIETADGATFSKSTAEPTYAKTYFVNAGDTVLEDAGELVCYAGGYFNKNVLKINDAQATDTAIELLKTKNIFVTDVHDVESWELYN